MAPRSSIAVLVWIALVIAACGGGGSTPTAPGNSAGTNVVEVQLTDALRIEPDPISIAVGVPVTFRVTNTGATEHEFYVGDEEAQAEHEQEMSQGGMAHDDPNGITVAPGATEELTLTLQAAGQTIAGCHIPGHYPAGMKAVITIGS